VIIIGAIGLIFFPTGSSTGKASRKADSLRQIQLAARLDPAASYTLGHYADRLLRVGNFKESIEQFQAAIELDPAGSNLRFRLAEALEKNGQLDRAASELAEAYIIRGEPDIAAEFKQQYRCPAIRKPPPKHSASIC
jgi:predicted Zn-dependent protease